jgi:hypothetical protein
MPIYCAYIVGLSATKMSGIDFDYGWQVLMSAESQNEWMILRLTCSAPWCILLALIVRDSRARPFLLTGNTGTTHRVHTRRAQTLQCAHPRC